MCTKLVAIEYMCISVRDSLSASTCTELSHLSHSPAGQTVVRTSFQYLKHKSLLGTVLTVRRKRITFLWAQNLADNFPLKVRESKFPSNCNKSKLPQANYILLHRFGRIRNLRQLMRELEIKAIKEFYGRIRNMRKIKKGQGKFQEG